MRAHPVVVVSSTAHDLPDYRDQVKDACLRASMHPNMMEQLPALDTDAIAASLALVDEADVYVGLFAHRYGCIPEGHHTSITEMEYDRAVKRGIPRLIFLMSDDVPVLPKDIDKGGAAKIRPDRVPIGYAMSRFAYVRTTPSFRFCALQFLNNLNYNKRTDRRYPDLHLTQFNSLIAEL